MDTAAPSAAPDVDYRIAIRSIGTAGASIVSALKAISSLPENVLAAKLYQAPSILFKGLNLDIAEQAVAALRSAGLECDVLRSGEPFSPGDAEHEVALVIQEWSRMGSVLQAVVEILGVNAVHARKLVCASPAVLIGNVSLATTVALRRRFEPLGVELDVSRPAEAEFDVFLGECSAIDRDRVVKTLAALEVTVLEREDGAPQPLLATGLARPVADRVWSELCRSGNYPVTLVNRDFQRFDLRMDEAEATPEMTTFLVETAKIPERLVPKVLSRLPVVTHPNIRFADLCRHLATIAGLGGRASGHLLAFQTFSLAIDKVGDASAANRVLRAIAGLSQEDATRALTTSRVVAGPLTSTQARWLHHELKQSGTTSRLVLR